MQEPPRLREASLCGLELGLTADAPRAISHLAIAHDARTDHTAIFVFGIRVIAATMAVAGAATMAVVIVRKTRADADAEGANLDARATSVRAEEDLPGGRGGNAECGNCDRDDEKFAHENSPENSLIKLCKHNARCACFVRLN